MNVFTIGPVEHGLAADDQGSLGALQRRAQVTLAVGGVVDDLFRLRTITKLIKRLTLGIIAKVVVRVGQVHLAADDVDLGLGVQPRLADARIDQGRLVARVTANDDDAIGLLNANNGLVHRVVRAEVGGGVKRLLGAYQLGATLIDQVLHQAQRLQVGKGAGDGGN